MDRIYTIEEIKRISVPVAEKFGVKKLALFGSYARGSQKNTSDIDFIIDKGNIKGLRFFSFINNLEDEFGVRVDVITYDNLKESLFEENVWEDEVVLYER
ncbi:MAG: nucleotidyltransferase domain-containing protein [Oscillospiraceae bacterium]|nr:nucleotidyltransferase domain-containing protein [Oscillospiraceae bacterium]